MAMRRKRLVGNIIKANDATRIAYVRRVFAAMSRAGHSIVSTTARRLMSTMCCYSRQHRERHRRGFTSARARGNRRAHRVLDCDRRRRVGSARNRAGVSARPARVVCQRRWCATVGDRRSPARLRRGTHFAGDRRRSGAAAGDRLPGHLRRDPRLRDAGDVAAVGTDRSTRSTALLTSNDIRSTPARTALYRAPLIGQRQARSFVNEAGVCCP